MLTRILRVALICEGLGPVAKLQTQSLLRDSQFPLPDQEVATVGGNPGPGSAPAGPYDTRPAMHGHESCKLIAVLYNRSVTSCALRRTAAGDEQSGRTNLVVHRSRACLPRCGGCVGGMEGGQSANQPASKQQAKVRSLPRMSLRAAPAGRTTETGHGLWDVS
ncbi:hypothetical protein M8818_003546 [Zalaria obscura]|uniref:Uncharacterized protein n=1 Tax=Zalaria obscura TaxID=2024903 RepID=A0ACC3SEX6_9PEZI